MRKILIILGLILCGSALFGQSPRIRLNQIQKDTVWGSVLISSPVDSNLTYSRDFFIGPDTSLNFYGTVLVAGGGGGGGSFVTTTLLSDSLANYILKVAGFGGDVSGTYDNLTVIDDSHNHIISNVDGLQTALDSKLSAEVDGSVTNEGSLSVGVGGANSSTINSNTSGSNAVTIEGGTDITVTESGSTITISSTAAGGGGTVTSVDIAAGTGISVSGSPITTSGTITVTNSAPDQTVSLTGAGINSVTGTYPNFTITGTEVDGSTTNELQTISTSGASGNISLSNGGGTLNLNVNDADASASNEGSLTVGAGGANSSDIVSNTSGSTNVTIAGGTNVTVTESGSTITIASTGGGSSFNNLTETADTVFVAKYLNVDTATLYVDADLNRVGIGTSAPTELLEVVDGNFIVRKPTASGGVSFSLIKTDTSTSWMRTNLGTAGGGISFKSDKRFSFTGNVDIGATVADFSQGFVVYGADYTAVAGRAGNVGFGTEDPQDKVSIYKPTGSVSTRVYSGDIGDNESTIFTASAENRLASIGVYKHSGITNNCGFLYVTAEDNEDRYIWSDNSGNLRISATITHIGTTSGTVVGAQTSDKRLKYDLGEFQYGLNDLMELKPVRFSYKDDQDQNPKIGFYAQDAMAVIPESVYDTKEFIKEGEITKLGMDYSALIPVLVKSIQEQQAIINQQQTQINDLLQRIITLENK